MGLTGNRYGRQDQRRPERVGRTTQAPQIGNHPGVGDDRIQPQRRHEPSEFFEMGMRGKARRSPPAGQQY